MAQMTVHADEELASGLAKNLPDLSSDRERVALPGNSQQDKLAITVDDVLSEEECAWLIQRTEQLGYESALVNVGNGNQVADNEFRKSGRCVLDSPEVAAAIWQRISKYLPDDETRERFGGIQGEYESTTQAVGLNERLRFLKYEPGDYFAPHFDGCFMRGASSGLRMGERSKMTLMVYLNGGFSGGSTDFVHVRDESMKVSVAPKAGRILCFDHHIYHAGEELTSGTKYAIRMDVMYSNKGADHVYSANKITLSGQDPSDANAGLNEA
jgi:hypothetical protein